MLLGLSPCREIYFLTGDVFPCFWRNTMKVEFTLECFAGYLSKNQAEHIDDALVDAITAQAINAWENRPNHAESIRILVKMPATSGQHFRYLEVCQKNENTLHIFHHR